MLFDEKNPIVSVNSYSTKLFSCLFSVFVFVSFLVAVIRNNPKSQPMEAFIFISGIIFFVATISFATPLLFYWAHIHGYHLDHYEAAHRGGWYIFRLNGT